MSAAMLRLVIVLYRSPLRCVSSTIQQLEAAAFDIPVIVSVVINRDRPSRYRSCRRRMQISKSVALEVYCGDNAYGVTGAYNLAIANANPVDVLVLLDGDSQVPSSYFQEVWARRELLSSGLIFISPQMFVGARRISPYRLSGITPLIIEGPLASGELLAFASGIGVINSCLAGSIASFRQIDGFSEHISLDLSDVAWSIEAGKKGAYLQLLPTSREHDLSMLSSGFSRVRLKKYLVACWRLGRLNGDMRGYVRLSLRGILALRGLRPLRACLRR